MKPVMAVLALLAFSLPAFADTQTWDVTASCDSFFGPCSDPATINAVFTTQLEFGTFFRFKFASYITGFEPVITDISGTFDGMAMTLGSGYFLDSTPEYVAFTAGGNEYSILLDGFYLFEDSAAPLGGMEIVNLNAVETTAVPEPNVALLSLIGLLGLVLRGRIKRSFI